MLKHIAHHNRLVVKARLEESYIFSHAMTANPVAHKFNLKVLRVLHR